MTVSDLYKELGLLTKDRERWDENIPYVASLLTHESVKIKAKALWLIGEMGLAYRISQNRTITLMSRTSRPLPLMLGPSSPATEP